jgi:imidazolonepropionase-like amidohydrolase
VKRHLLAAAAAIGLAATPLAAQTIAITGGTVAIGDGSEPLQGATVVIRDGKILAAGHNVAIPRGADVVDARGKWVTPGIVGGFSRLGLSEVDLSGGVTDDRAQNSLFSAALDVAPAINPAMTTIAVNREDGVTRAIVAPNVGRAIFGGQGAMMDLGTDPDPVTRSQLFQFVEFGERGANVAGGSRPSLYAWFRNALREAQEIAGRPSGARRDDVILPRIDAAALIPVVQGRQYLLIHAEQSNDIRQVIKLAREFPRLKPVIVGATEGWTVAGEIAASGIPVIASAVNDLPGSFEQLAATQSNVGRMRGAGVNVAIGMIDDNDTRYLFNQRQYAANLVALAKVPGAAGVRWGEALAMITSKPAEVVGMGGQVGSLARGRAGDVVIWSGDPLELASKAEAVWIDGVAQPLESRQTKLRDRYKDLDRKALPEAYRR